MVKLTQHWKISQRKSRAPWGEQDLQKHKPAAVMNIHRKVENIVSHSSHLRIAKH